MPRAVKPLIKTLNEKNNFAIHVSAATALGQFKDDRALKALIQALNIDQDDIARMTIDRSIHSISKR